MGRLNEFELAIKKIDDSPLTYEAQIPPGCHFFQDVRRYQSIGPHMEIRVIPVDGRMALEPEMVPVPIQKLNGSERKALVDYLTVRVTRGDNIGYAWAFFKPADSKGPIVGYGGNVVNNESAVGKERVRKLISLLQKEKGVGRFHRRWRIGVAVGFFAVAAAVAAMQYGHWITRWIFPPAAEAPFSPEMAFYKTVFPTVSRWYEEGETERQAVANALLDPGYIAGILQTLSQPCYRATDKGEKGINQGNRMILFVYFNYNSDVDTLLNTHTDILQGTEFKRLSGIYSTRQSGYASNIFYYKVGDLDIEPAEISRFMTHNMISYQDIEKIRDETAFSTLMARDSVNYKMEGFLENVYTFTPLRIVTPATGRAWYLLVRGTTGGALDFAAFFHRAHATLVPKRIGNLLLGKDAVPGDMVWYALDNVQADDLNLSADNALTYFSRETGQAHELDIVREKIDTLGLTALNSAQVRVTIHRELLMADEEGTYGLQTHDPITSLVLSNLITQSSFERKSHVPLKRDPIQFNTTLVQLSKDDSFSVQRVTITPGTTTILRLFEPMDRFMATFRDGTSALFEKARVNLFNPFSFMVSTDSITFSFRHEIEDMTFKAGNTRLKIVKARDGNYQIVDDDRM